MKSIGKYWCYVMVIPGRVNKHSQIKFSLNIISLAGRKYQCLLRTPTNIYPTVKIPKHHQMSLTLIDVGKYYHNFIDENKEHLMFAILTNRMLE